MPNLVLEITNNDYRIQVRVWLIEGKYVVTLLDLDAERFVPTTVMFNERANAIDYAKRLAA